MSYQDWELTSCRAPARYTVVDTKIHYSGTQFDGRCQLKIMKHWTRWVEVDGHTVTSAPTHWRPIPEATKEAVHNGG